MPSAGTIYGSYEIETSDATRNVNALRAALKRNTDEQLRAQRAGRQLGGSAREVARQQGQLDASVRRSTVGLTAFRAGMLGAAAAAGTFVRAGIRFNAQVETSTLQFKALLGSTEAAEKRVKSLTDFAASTPFQLPGLIESSRLLQTFGGDMLASEQNLRLFGDAAAGVGAPIQDVSMWVGRMYANLEGGQPIGEAVTRFTELGLVSGPTATKLREMAQEGAGLNATMDVLFDEWGQYSGSMEEMSRTTAGLESTFSDLTSQTAGLIIETLEIDDAYKGLLYTVNTLMRLLGKSDPIVQAEADVKRLELALADAGKGLVGFSDSFDGNSFAYEQYAIQLEQARERLREVKAATEGVTEATRSQVDTLHSMDEINAKIAENQRLRIAQEEAARKSAAYEEERLIKEAAEKEKAILDHRLEGVRKHLDDRTREWEDYWAGINRRAEEWASNMPEIGLLEGPDHLRMLERSNELLAESVHQQAMVQWAAEATGKATEDTNEALEKGTSLFGGIANIARDIGQAVGGKSGSILAGIGSTISEFGRMADAASEVGDAMKSSIFSAIAQLTPVVGWFMNIFTLGSARAPVHEHLRDSSRARQKWVEERYGTTATTATTETLPSFGGGGGGARGPTAADIRKQALEAEEKVIQEQVNAWKEELRVKENLLAENERILEKMLYDFEFYKQGIDDIVGGTMTYDAFDRWIGQLEEAGRLTGVLADEMRGLARASLLDTNAMEEAAKYFGFDPLLLGPSYRQFKAAEDIDEFSRHYKQLLLSGLNDSEIVDLLKRSHRDWEEQLQHLVNDGRTLEEAIRELGGGSSLMRIEDVFGEAAAWGVAIPDALSGFVSALTGADGLPETIRKSIEDWSPNITFTELESAVGALPDVQELKDALQSKVGTPLYNKIEAVRGKARDIQNAVNAVKRRIDTSNVKLDAITTAIEALELDPTINVHVGGGGGAPPPPQPPDDGGLGGWDELPPTDQPAGTERDGTHPGSIDKQPATTPAEIDVQKQASIRALRNWYQKAAGMRLWSGEAERLLAGTASYSKMYRWILGQWSEAGSTRKIAGRKPVSDPGIWPDHESFWNSAMRPVWMGAPRRQAGGPLDRDRWTLVGEEGPELIQWKPNGGRPMVHSNQQSNEIAKQESNRPINVTLVLDGDVLAEKMIERFPKVSDRIGI